MKYTPKTTVNDITEGMLLLRLKPHAKPTKKAKVPAQELSTMEKLYIKSFIPKIIVTDHANLCRTLSETELHKASPGKLRARSLSASNLQLERKGCRARNAFLSIDRGNYHDKTALDIGYISRQFGHLQF